MFARPANLLRQRKEEPYSVIQREQRRSRRFPIHLPLTVRRTEGNLLDEIVTETRDVSSGGLRFFLPEGLKIGSRIEILMTFPHELTQAGPVRVRCRGRVVRNNLESSGQAEVSASIERFQFTRNAKNVA
jgi:hypothetical protein